MIFIRKNGNLRKASRNGCISWKATAIEVDQPLGSPDRRAHTIATD